MCLNNFQFLDVNKDKLYPSLTDEKINFLKKFVFGGFNYYNKFIKYYRRDLFLDTRYKDEICNYLDNLMLNIIKNQIPTYGSRELREHKIIKALNNDDYFTLASIIASAARSAVSFVPTIKHSIASYYKIYEHEYYEINFEEIEKLDSNQFNLT